MVALSVQNQKQFMSRLLTTDLFDRFDISEAVIRTGVSFSIDTHLTKGFYSAEELESMGLKEGAPLPFSMLRQTFYDLIRGSHTPLFFRFVLMLSAEEKRELLSQAEESMGSRDINGFFLNLSFQNGALCITTAVDYRTFLPTRLPDRIWDHAVKEFLEKNGIIFEEIG